MGIDLKVSAGLELVRAVQLSEGESVIAAAGSGISSVTSGKWPKAKYRSYATTAMRSVT